MNQAEGAEEDPLPPLRHLRFVNIYGFPSEKERQLPRNGGHIDILGIAEHWYVQNNWFFNHPSFVVSTVEDDNEHPAVGHSHGGVALFVKPHLRNKITWTWSSDCIAMMSLGGIIYAVTYFRPSWSGARTKAALEKIPRG